MTIITKDIRYKVTQAVLKHAFAEELTAFMQEEQVLLAKIYKAAYSAEVVAALKVIYGVSRESVYCRRSLKVNLGGMSITVGGDRGDMDHIKPIFEMQDWLVPYSHQYSNHKNLTLSVEDPNPFAEEIMNHARKRDEINSRIALRRAEVSGVLSQTRTDKQLQLRWPEVMPLARPFLRDVEPAQLPMVPLITLNAALGLPIEEELAA